MRLVEKHFISKSNLHYKEIDNTSFLSKNIYNKANYIVRQEFIKTSKEKENGLRKNARWIRAFELQKIFQDSKDADYYSLPCKISQQVLRQTEQNWRSFFESAKDYKNNPHKYKNRPKLPRYKHKADGRNILLFGIQALRGGRSKNPFKNGIIKFCKPFSFSIKTKQKNIKSARIIPLNNRRYKIEIIYEKRKSKRKFNKKFVAGIDIGVNNLSAVTSNLKGFNPLLINGRPLKNINQYFNKRKAELLSELMKADSTRRTSNSIDDLTFKRNCKIEDYLHKASRFLINHLADLKIGTLIIGKNPNWKQEPNIGKQNNQNFVSIPHARYIEMLKYKAEMIGMKVIIREEAHTSKCSFIDMERIGHQENYIGRRIKRGLFRSSNGTIINADCNGSGNIIRKEIPNAFANGIEGVVVRPIRVTIPITGKPIIKNCNAYKLVA